MNRNRAVYYSAAVFLAAWSLLPVYFLVVSALQERRSTFKWPKEIFPQQFSWTSVAFFFELPGMLNAAMNSVIAASITMVLALALGAPAGYALARFTFPGKNGYRVLVLLTRAFPVPILALPLAVRFIEIGLYDTPYAVAIVHACLALPFAVLVTSSLFVGIPRELEEAAWILGCSRFKAFCKVLLPLALPGLTATAVFAFVVSWNEVFAATLLTLRERTLTAFLLSMLDEAPIFVKFAGGFFLVVPAVVFIFTVRRYLFSLWGVTSR